MKLTRSFLNISLTILVFLTVFTVGYLVLKNTLLPWIATNIQLKSSKAQIQTLTGAAVLAYLEDGQAHLTIKSWDTSGRYIFNSFEGPDSVPIERKEASPNAAPKPEEKIKPSDIKPGAQVRVGFFVDSSGVRHLSSVSQTFADGGSSELTGVVENVSAKEFVLNVDSVQFKVGLSSSVMVGSLFSKETINGKEIMRPGKTNEAKDFGSLKFGNRVQVFYENSSGSIIVAQRLLIIE